MKRPGERRSISRSATRALDVLEHFGLVRRPVRANEITTVLGLHPSTTNQLLKTMVESAHLVFDSRSKTYLPSPRLAGFCGWIVTSFGSGDSLSHLVRDAQSAVGDVVTLTTPNDLLMQILDLAGEGPEREAAERGLSISVFGSVIGSAYLSILERHDIQLLAARARIPMAQVPKILDSAARIRAEGFADGPTPDGSIWSIAIPLPARKFPVPLVLGYAGASKHVQPRRETIYSHMRDAMARYIS